MTKGNHPVPQRNKADRRFASTLARGLSVLRAFRPTDDGLGNAEISKRTGLPKSTVSRLTFTLQQLGYLHQAHRHDRYRPGPTLLVLGNLVNNFNSFVDLSAPMMQQLADKTGTLTLLLVRDQNKLLILKTWRPQTVASIWLEVGHRVPFNGTSSGHALLASLSEESFSRAVLDADGDHDLTSARAELIRSRAQEQLKSQGFHITDPNEYYTENIHAVAVPFKSHDMSEPVIFACGALPEVLSVSRMHTEVGPELRSVVREVERFIGMG